MVLPRQHAQRRGAGRGETEMALRRGPEVGRFAGAARSCAIRSTPGRHAAVSTFGAANAASSPSAGWIDINSATVTPSRRIHPQVENTDM